MEGIAEALWPRKKPEDLIVPSMHPPRLPTKTAVRASMSLLFRLWTYIPYRKRNIIDMQLGDNLHKDAEGHWRIRFQGEQLKIGLRNGRPNVFDLPFPPKLVPVLEDFLTLWRPYLVAKSPHPDHEQHVFLTRWGKPYSSESFTAVTRNIVYRYTKQHWHPHIVRTVWATEMIHEGLDLLKVAKMLNDKLETVIATYAHLLDKNIAEEVYGLIDRRNGQGK
jgi:hypothetical protein